MPPEKPKKPFNFEFTLSVLNHLGRYLYRNFATILGEAISNSWDAEAENVWIYFDKEKNTLKIKDDGIGMSEDDFQNKFLKIGYSKRKKGGDVSPQKKRPYIGRKGIGKLALLSCADEISIISKIAGTTEYTRGKIDNNKLDEAIDEEKEIQDYSLENVPDEIFAGITDGHKKGTIIVFEKLKPGDRATEEHLRKIIALHFRFSLVCDRLKDDHFTIHLNGKTITTDDLRTLTDSAQFLWTINGNSDDEQVTNIPLPEKKKVTGFIASVCLPKQLNIFGTGEKVGIDLFVNGRLRATNISKEFKEFSSKILPSYLYGQIHCDELDDGSDDTDRFTTNREGIVGGDPEYEKLIKYLGENVIKRIIREWDKFREELGEDGDPENATLRKRATVLCKKTAENYIPEGKSGRQARKWLKEFLGYGSTNISAYAECFASENFLRKSILAKKPDWESKSSYKGERAKAAEHKKNEEKSIKEREIVIRIRAREELLHYLGMEDLAKIIKDGDRSDIRSTAREYTPIRNAVAHTSPLTDEAKRKLTTIFDKIKAKKDIFSS